MIIELGDNGVRSRYEWQSYEILGVNDPTQAAYQAIRQCCKFLTDDNHTWEAKDYGECKPEHLKLKELTQSSRYSIKIFRSFPTVFPGNHFQPVGSYWFHFGYRVPGQPY